MLLSLCTHGPVQTALQEWESAHGPAAAPYCGLKNADSEAEAPAAATDEPEKKAPGSKTKKKPAAGAAKCRIRTVKKVAAPAKPSLSSAKAVKKPTSSAQGRTGVSKGKPSTSTAAKAKAKK